MKNSIETRVIWCYKELILVAAEVLVPPVNSREVLTAGGTSGVAPVVEEHPLVLLGLFQPTHSSVSRSINNYFVLKDFWSVMISKCAKFGDF